MATTRFLYYRIDQAVNGDTTEDMNIGYQACRVGRTLQGSGAPLKPGDVILLLCETAPRQYRVAFGGTIVGHTPGEQPWPDHNWDDVHEVDVEGTLLTLGEDGLPQPVLVALPGFLDQVRRRRKRLQAMTAAGIELKGHPGFQQQLADFVQQNLMQ